MRQGSSIAEIRGLLALAKGSGRVEFKRSCLWPQDGDPIKVQQVLVRLANANPEVGGVIELGREDSGVRVGLVDQNLQPITPEQLATAEQRLVQIADRVVPQMPIRWHRLPHQGGLETVAVEVPGRARGRWYQDERGVAVAGSASHPVVATCELLRSWVLEDAEERERHRRITAFQLQIDQLRRQAHATVRAGDGILTHPDRLNVEVYNRLLPDVCSSLPVSDPRMQRLHELPTLAGRINRLMNLTRQERRVEFSVYPGNPYTQCALAIEGNVSELERACEQCGQWLTEIVGPLGG